MPIRFEPVTPLRRRLKVVRAFDYDRVRKVPFQTSAVDVVLARLGLPREIFVWSLVALLMLKA